MSGFLDRLAARAVGEAPLAHPRVRACFEPDAGTPVEEIAEVGAAVEVRRPVVVRGEVFEEAAGERSRLRRAPHPLAPSPIAPPSPGRGGASPSPTLPDLDTAAPAAFPLSRVAGGDGRGGQGVRGHDAAPSEELPQATEHRRPASPESIEPHPPLRPRHALTADLPTVEADRHAPLPPFPPVVAANEPSETVVHVSIGRIDVRAAQPPAPERRPAPRPSGPRLTLADYLNRREERRR